MIQSLPKSSVVFDLGSGYGRHTILASAAGHEVLAVDRKEAVCDRLKENLTTLPPTSGDVSVLNCDLRDVSIKSSGLADLVICTGVLQHARDVSDLTGLLAHLSKLAGQPAALIYIEMLFEMLFDGRPPLDGRIKITHAEFEGLLCGVFPATSWALQRTHGPMRQKQNFAQGARSFEPPAATIEIDGGRVSHSAARLADAAAQSTKIRLSGLCQTRITMQMTFGKGAALRTLLIAAVLSGGISYAADVASTTGAHLSPQILLIGETFAQHANFRAVQVASMFNSPTNSRLPVVIISDPVEYGDDSIAILMLLESRRIDIRGIITTSGNVCASRGATEATRLVQSAGAASIPIVQGFPFRWHDDRRRFYEEVERPAWQRAAYVGAFADPRSCNSAGDGGVPGKDASNTEAADFLIDQVSTTREELTIILIGPATVLAEAMRREPHLGDHIHHIYAMGGAIAVAGNVTQYAEFNVWFDPEAMAAILASKVPLTLVPLDATVGITYECVPLRNSTPRNFAASHLQAYLDRAGAKGKPVRLWDEVLAAIVIDPAIAVTTRETYLSVSTTKDERYGKLIYSPAAADRNSRPVDVVSKVRSDGVCQLVTQLLLTGG